MARTSVVSAVGSAQKGKHKGAGGASRPRPSGKKPGAKHGSAAKTKRATDGQMARQLALVKEIKAKLTAIVERFDAAYPEGVNFTPGAKELDLV